MMNQNLVDYSVLGRSVESMLYYIIIQPIVKHLSYFDGNNTTTEQASRGLYRFSTASLVSKRGCHELLRPLAFVCCIDPFKGCSACLFVSFIQSFSSCFHQADSFFPGLHFYPFVRYSYRDFSSGTSLRPWSSLGHMNIYD